MDTGSATSILCYVCNGVGAADSLCDLPVSTRHRCGPCGGKMEMHPIATVAAADHSYLHARSRRRKGAVRSYANQKKVEQTCLRGISPQPIVAISISMHVTPAPG